MPALHPVATCLSCHRTAPWHSPFLLEAGGTLEFRNSAVNCRYCGEEAQLHNGTYRFDQELGVILFTATVEQKSQLRSVVDELGPDATTEALIERIDAFWPALAQFLKEKAQSIPLATIVALIALYMNVQTLGVSRESLEVAKQGLVNTTKTAEETTAIARGQLEVAREQAALNKERLDFDREQARLKNVQVTKQIEKRRKHAKQAAKSKRRNRT